MRETINRIVKGARKLRKHGLGDVFISSVYTEIIGFLASIFIVRMFSKDAYGYYAIAYNIYGYIAVFVGCGLNNAVLQYCSEKRDDNEKRGIYTFCLKFGSIFNIFLLAIIPLLSLVLLPDLPRKYLLLMSGWPFVAYLSNYYLMRLRVIKDNRHFMLSNVISASFFIALAAFMAKTVGIVGYIVALYCKYIISFTLSKFYLHEDNSYFSKSGISNDFKKEIIRYSIVCCLTNFASTIMMLVDVTCVNYFVGDPSVVATYKTATQIPTALLFVPSSVIVFVFPYLAEHNKDLLWLKNNVKKLNLAVVAVNVIIGIVVYILAPFIVRILWGERYLDAVEVLRILVLNFVVTGTFNKVYGNLMVVVKKVNVNLAKTIVFSVLNVILDTIFIKYYGSIGAAIATLIVSIGSSIFSYAYYRLWLSRQLKLS